MKFTSDVNIIFAYADNNHKFQKKVISYIARRQKDKFILLSKLKNNFIHTYSGYLVTCCIIIENAVRKEIKKRSQSPSKTYKPSTFTITRSVQSLIDDYLEKESAKFMSFNKQGVRTYINRLLTDYSISRLYFEENALAEFREKYSVESEERALEVLNRFLRFFRKFESMNIEEYSIAYEKWLNEIKNSDKNIFDNKKDHEDIILASELLAYNQEKSKLDFVSCDKEMCRSLKVVSKEFDFTLGKIDLIS